MAPLLSRPSTSSAPSAALFYITIGSLLTAWSAIWYVYLSRNESDHQFVYYLCMGFLVTGLVLLVIGLAIGPMARFFRKVEAPTPEETAAEAERQRTS